MISDTNKNIAKITSGFYNINNKRVYMHTYRSTNLFKSTEYLKKIDHIYSLKFIVWKKSAISRSICPIILASFSETMEFHELEFDNFWIKKLELYYKTGIMNELLFNIKLLFPLFFQRKRSDYNCLDSC